MMEVGVNSHLHPLMIFVDIMPSDVIFLLIKCYFSFKLDVEIHKTRNTRSVSFNCLEWLKYFLKTNRLEYNSSYF